MLIITLKQKQEREEGGNPLGILKQSLGNPEVASGQGTWPHRQVLLPKSHYYFLGMEKKVKK